MTKKQIHVVASTEKHSKDSDIEITTDWYADSDSDSAMVTRKFSAELKGVIARGFSSKEDAVKELNRKFSLEKNQETIKNYLKPEIMKKSIKELTQNLELAKKSIIKDYVKNDHVLLTSLQARIKSLESEIENYANDTHEKKPLAVKKDIPSKELPSKTTGHEKKVVKKEAPVKKEVKPATGSVVKSHGVVITIGSKVKFYNKKLGKTVTGKVTYQHKTKGTFTVEHAHGVSYPKTDQVEAA